MQWQSRGRSVQFHGAAGREIERQMLFSTTTACQCAGFIRFEYRQDAIGLQARRHA